MNPLRHFSFADLRAMSDHITETIEILDGMGKGSMFDEDRANEIQRIQDLWVAIRKEMNSRISQIAEGRENGVFIYTLDAKLPSWNITGKPEE